MLLLMKWTSLWTCSVRVRGVICCSSNSKYGKICIYVEKLWLTWWHHHNSVSNCQTIILSESVSSSLQCLHYRLQLATAGAKEKVCGLRPRVSPSEALACSSSTSGPYPTLTFGPLVLMISFAVSIVSSSSSSWFYVVNVHSSWDKGICCFKCSIECNLKCAHYCSILTSSP